MKYELRCEGCGEKSDKPLDEFNPNKEQMYTLTCDHCGRKNQRTFPSDFDIEKFYKFLKGKARLIFQKYDLEKKSFPQISRETKIPISTCYDIYTRKLGMRARNQKQAGRIYWRQKNGGK